MKIEDFAEESRRFLNEVLNAAKNSSCEESSENHSFGRKFILIHANHVQSLADDVIMLEDKGRTGSSPILVRGMLESLFILGAATRNPTFFGQKIVYDLEESARFARSDAKKADSDRLKQFLIQQAEVAEKNACNLKLRHNIENSEKWRPCDCAATAKLFRQYAIDYSNYSRSVHAELFSTVIGEDGRTSAHVMRTVAFICLETSRFAFGVFPPGASQQFAEKLANLFQQLHQWEQAETTKAMYQSEMAGESQITRHKRAAPFDSN